MDNKQLNTEIEDTVNDPVERILQDKKPKSSANGVAILALLVALAVAGESAWRWWQANSAEGGATSIDVAMEQLEISQQRQAESIRSFESQLDKIDTPVDPGAFLRMGEKQQANAQKLAELLAQSNQDVATLAALQGSQRSSELRLSTVESGLTTVAASSQNSSVELEIAEIDFLLRVANERLQLFGDAAAADMALQAADVQIEALNDPMFLTVRQRIATSRRQLASVPVIDRVDISTKITAIQAEVSDLPFGGETRAQPEPVPAEDAGWWEGFKQTLSSLVTVKRRVPEDQSSLSLDDKDYVRQGLWLQLESARLALMRNDASSYQDSLQRTNTTLEQFFENGASSVQAMLLQIADLLLVEVAPQMPDINAPWIKLRQLRDSRRLLQTATPVESQLPLEPKDTVDGNNGE